MAEQFNASPALLPVPHSDWIDHVASRDPIFPESGWLARYVDWAARNKTDAPLVYHLAVGLCIVAANLRNNCWVEVPWGRIYPSVWCVLLAGSSYTRKSTAVQTGQRILESLEKRDSDDEGVPNTKRRSLILPHPGSREAFMSHLSKQPYGLLIAEEFGELLAALNREHMTGTKEMLTRMWDGSSSAQVTIGRATETVENPAITLLGASTPDWLEDRVKEGDVRGGFLARFMFWPIRPGDERPAWRNPIEEHAFDKEQWHLLTQSLNLQRVHQGAVKFTPEAVSAYGEWLRPHEQDDPGADFPRDLMGAHSRLTTNVLKLALLFEVASENHASKHIGERSMRQALYVANWLKARMRVLFTEDLAFGKHAQDERKVLAGITGETSRTDLIRRLRWPVRQLDDTLQSLIEGGQIECFQGASGKAGGRPGSFYRRTS